LKKRAAHSHLSSRSLLISVIVFSWHDFIEMMNARVPGVQPFLSLASLFLK
jgi:hypothetical protein